jgi:hypothetical protein
MSLLLCSFPSMRLTARIRYARLYGVVGRDLSYRMRDRTRCPTHNTREHTTSVTTVMGA